MPKTKKTASLKQTSQVLMPNSNSINQNNLPVIIVGIDTGFRHTGVAVLKDQQFATFTYDISKDKTLNILDIEETIANYDAFITSLQEHLNFSANYFYEIVCELTFISFGLGNTLFTYYCYGLVTCLANYLKDKAVSYNITIKHNRTNTKQLKEAILFYDPSFNEPKTKDNKTKINNLLIFARTRNLFCLNTLNLQTLTQDEKDAVALVATSLAKNEIASFEEKEAKKKHKS